MREAAAREAELLAGELSQRMQLVTAQLSERVEHLMDLQSMQAVDRGGASDDRERARGDEARGAGGAAARRGRASSAAAQHGSGLRSEGRAGARRGGDAAQQRRAAAD